MESLDFNNISIRGRVVFAVECLLKVTTELHIVTGLDTFIVNLLEFTSCDKLELWDTKIKIQLPKNMNNETISENFEYDEELSEKEQNLLTNVFLEVLNVGRANLYKNFENNITLKHVMNLVSLLKENKIELPNVDKLKFSMVSENDGWGNVFNCKIGSDDAYENDDKMDYVVDIEVI